jgi:hypothetical protein
MGERVRYDKARRRYFLENRATGKKELISEALEGAAQQLLEQQRGRSSSQAQQTPPPPPPLGPSRTELLKALEDDANSMITIMKSRLDPRAPVMTKFVEDVSWWQHLMLDFSKQAVPEVFSLMGAEDIDVRNPEATAQKMVGKLKAIKEKALKAEELEAKAKTVEEEYKARLSALEEALRKYKEVIDEQGKIIEDLVERSKKTIAFFMVVLPEKLPMEVRHLYRKLASGVKTLWGVSE